MIAAMLSELAPAGVDTTTRMALRLVVAALLAGLIGWEREQKGRAAGLRTHILVALGSALFMLAPGMAGIAAEHNTRVMQGIASGIGLVGAGAVLRSRVGARVEGLTTAASIWLTAAIGMAAGMGMLVLAILAAGIGWIVVAAIPKLIGETPAHQEDRN
jgi:putative Mg2+ transporter-C (MgtC) family protein